MPGRACDLPFSNIFVSQFFSRISDKVIACDLWFGPPKILATCMFKTLHFGLNFESNLAQGEEEAEYIS